MNDSRTEKYMSRMVDAAQPHCDEPILAAMTCSHAGSMSSAVFSKLLGGMTGMDRTSDLPNPVFIAVGADTIYAFDYKPRGFKYKIKKEVARWPRNDLTIAVEETERMCYFTMTTGSGDTYPMEVATVMGAKPLVDRFMGVLRG
jgi:hypothetical protein